MWHLSINATHYIAGVTEKCLWIEGQDWCDTHKKHIPSFPLKKRLAVQCKPHEQTEKCSWIEGKDWYTHKNTSPPPPSKNASQCSVNPTNSFNRTRLSITSRSTLGDELTNNLPTNTQTIEATHTLVLGRAPEHEQPIENPIDTRPSIPSIISRDIDFLDLSLGGEQPVGLKVVHEHAVGAEDYPSLSVPAFRPLISTKASVEVETLVIVIIVATWSVNSITVVCCTGVIFCCPPPEKIGPKIGQSVGGKKCDGVFLTKYFYFIFPPLPPAIYL